MCALELLRSAAIRIARAIGIRRGRDWARWLPDIVYFQTVTACNGHCRYCPFDDVYEAGQVTEMSEDCYFTVLAWLESQGYSGRIGYLLHYEPTLDPRMPDWIRRTREILPGCRLEVATNGLLDSPILSMVDVVDVVEAGSRTWGTTRAGNARACPENNARTTFPWPCSLPTDTICVAADGSLLLCCQDWRHEAVVGTYRDMMTARKKQLALVPKVHSRQLEICLDCFASKTAEEVGDRLGERSID